MTADCLSEEKREGTLGLLFLTDLRGYDIVVSSSSAWAHGVIVDEGATHVCYCHNPFRYAWNARDETL